MTKDQYNQSSPPPINIEEDLETKPSPDEVTRSNIIDSAAENLETSQQPTPKQLRDHSRRRRRRAGRRQNRKDHFEKQFKASNKMNPNLSLQMLPDDVPPMNNTVFNATGYGIIAFVALMLINFLACLANSL